MIKLIAVALFATMFLSSCAALNRTLQLPGRTIQGLARTVGF